MGIPVSPPIKPHWVSTWDPFHSPFFQYYKSSFRTGLFRRHRLYVWYHDDSGKKRSPFVDSNCWKEITAYCVENFGSNRRVFPRWSYRVGFYDGYVEFRRKEDAMLMKLAFTFENCQTSR